MYEKISLLVRWLAGLFALWSKPRFGPAGKAKTKTTTKNLCQKSLAGSCGPSPSTSSRATTPATRRQQHRQQRQQKAATKPKTRWKEPKKKQKMEIINMPQKYTGQLLWQPGGGRREHIATATATASESGLQLQLWTLAVFRRQLQQRQQQFN